MKDNLSINIRSEEVADLAVISRINDTAFGQKDEGALIENLRNSTGFNRELSLVAEHENKVVGHILFTPISINDGGIKYDSLALAPMCVLPDFQRIGVGGQLIKWGIKIASGLSYTSIIVLGHKDYYPKFGFIPASKFGVMPPFKVGDEYFMALELIEGGLSNVQGVVEYPKAFSEVT